MVGQWNFMCFYDFLEEKLLRVMIKSKVSSELLGELNETFIALIPKQKEP